MAQRADGRPAVIVPGLADAVIGVENSKLDCCVAAVTLGAQAAASQTGVLAWKAELARRIIKVSIHADAKAAGCHCAELTPIAGETPAISCSPARSRYARVVARLASCRVLIEIANLARTGV